MSLVFVNTRLLLLLFALLFGKICRSSSCLEFSLIFSSFRVLFESLPEKSRVQCKLDSFPVCVDKPYNKEWQTDIRCKEKCHRIVGDVIWPEFLLSLSWQLLIRCCYWIYHFRTRMNYFYYCKGYINCRRIV